MVWHMNFLTQAKDRAADGSFMKRERNFLQGFTEKLIAVKRELRCTGVLFLYYFLN